MLKVGLTGGIGAGKSTVASRLAEHGAVVVDADVLAREVVAPGTEGLADVAAAFGTEVLAADGSLDRKALAELVFADDRKRLRLNQIVHPRVAARTAELIEAAPADAVVVHDVPLLVENGLAPAYHLVVVVSADAEVRVARLVDRGLAEADARARIASQATDAQRAEVADVWLANSGDRAGLLSTVDSLWRDRLVPYEANVRLRREFWPSRPVIVDYDPTWPAQARRLIARVALAVGEKAVRIDHIGSTAVPGLPAKDCVDLQLVVSTVDDADAIADAVSDAGFPRAPGEWADDSPHGGTPLPKRLHGSADPGRVATLHVRAADGPAWRWALMFRDWLRANDFERDSYAEVKRVLASKHATTASYADEKQSWVNAAFARAERWAIDSAWHP
ncbi:MAG: dephospho-CoA kinase [Sciscionella sp.]|nr:dephospho-CoA kinase [Sciscionella sp.]